MALIPITRRFTLAGIGSSLLAAPTIVSAAPAAAAVETTLLRGTQRGMQFAQAFPSLLGVQAGSWVDALLLNGNHYGGPGGGATPIYNISDDYISEFRVTASDRVHYVYFKTKNKNLVIEGGPPGPDPLYTGVRVLRIGGWYDAGGLYDIDIDYVANYQDSQIIESNAPVVIAFSPGKIDIKTYTESSLQYAQTYNNTIDYINVLKLDASASAKYLSTFSASTNLSATNTNEIKTVTTQAMNSAEKNTEEVDDTIAEDQIGVLEAEIDICKDPSGNLYFYPTRPGNWLKVGLDQGKRFIGKYDFTVGFDTQMGLQHGLKNGFPILQAQT